MNDVAIQQKIFEKDERLAEILFSSLTHHHLHQLCLEYGILFGVSDVERLIARVMIGEVKIENFVSELEREFKLPTSEAEELTMLIDGLIFSHIRPILNGTAAATSTNKQSPSDSAVPLSANPTPETDTSSINTAEITSSRKIQYKDKDPYRMAPDDDTE